MVCQETFGKLDLKATIIRQAYGNKKWELLQVKVYGEWIENADKKNIKNFIKEK